VVIFAQMEFLGRIRRIRNLIDRAALKYIINPLSEQETAQMIQFRLQSAGLEPGRALFSPEAIRAIHRFTQGYPRRIALVCHNALEALVMHDRSIVEEGLVQELIRDESRWFVEAAA